MKNIVVIIILVVNFSFAAMCMIEDDKSSLTLVEKEYKRALCNHIKEKSNFLIHSESYGKELKSELQILNGMIRYPILYKKAEIQDFYTCVRKKRSDIIRLSRACKIPISLQKHALHMNSAGKKENIEEIELKLKTIEQRERELRLNQEENWSIFNDYMHRLYNMLYE